MKMMSFNTCSILWTVLFCFGLPSGVFGQHIQKETVGGKTYAVIYADSLAGAAQWGSGVMMMREGTTIRHQVSKGNGANLSVNDRIPFRFIVAPEDVGNNDENWMVAQGVNIGGKDELPDFSKIADTGCRLYGKSGQPGAGRNWRVPTQRELQLMWMFRETIGVIYNTKPMEEAGKAKRYWTSTEKGATDAWFFDFTPGKPHCDTQAKTTATGMVRCVSDY
ncbi:DUF1566 domain-containing protein [Bacteroides sp. BFG-606]|uniref:DUF1566 domain-containing protein n=1 Tax=Bacteroides sp. BFG-606 TaxID=2972763 RepID=UPI002166B13B|nr:DUF1566 domain-containing protein [Bacteroides sp. BFG-606]MCS2333701.1 DUF1566 domain-containing protein [Bacteroides sp. BFG-606]